MYCLVYMLSHESMTSYTYKCVFVTCHNRAFNCAWVEPRSHVPDYARLKALEHQSWLPLERVRRWTCTIPTQSVL